MRVPNINTIYPSKFNKRRHFSSSFSLNFTSCDIFNSSIKDEEYLEYKSKIKPHNNFILNRFEQLSRSKFKDDLSYREIYILSHPHNIESNFDVFRMKRGELSDLVDEDKKIEDYLAKCRFYGGTIFNDDDVKLYIDYKNDFYEDGFKIDEALRYIAFVRGYAFEESKMSIPEATFFAQEQWRLSEIEDFYRFLVDNPKIAKEYQNALDSGFNNIEIYKTQTKDGYNISFLRSNETTEDGDCVLTLEHSFGTTYKNKISRSEFYSDGTMYSHYVNSPNLTIMQAYNILDEDGYLTGDISIFENLELVADKNGPKKIIQTIKSDVLSGAYDVFEYNLKDYPEDMDVLDAIKTGQINGKPLATSFKTRNGSCFVADFKNGNLKNKIKYSNSINENGFEATSYQYKITDNKHNILLDIDRKFEQISENKTKTTINNDVYFCEFSDYDGYVSILNSKNELIMKFALFSSDNAVYGDGNFPAFIYDLDYDEVKNFALKLPADIMYIFGKSGYFLQFIDDADDAQADVESKVIYSTPSLSVFAHELAHTIDFDSENNIKNISTNEELVKIYEKELMKFNNDFPARVERKLIKYLSQNGGRNEDLRKIETYDDEELFFKNAGLSELVADAFSLYVTYGSEVEAVSHRVHFAKMFFPKTIAKAIELIEENISQ